MRSITPLNILTSTGLAMFWTLLAFGAVVRRTEPNGAIRWVATPSDKPPAFFSGLAAAGVDVPPNDRPFERSIAFLVGVSHYTYLKPQLPGVARDVADLRDTLLQVAGFDEVIELTDEHATREAIEGFLVDEFRNMNKQDRLLIYFAGHGADAGGTTGYFQLQNAQPNIFATNTLRIGDAVEWSRLIPAHHLLIIFDACASGFAFEKKGGSPQDEERDAVYTFSGRGSRTVITAGTGKEDTLEVELNGVKTGAFTHSLIAALKQSNSHFLVLTTERVFAETADHLASVLVTVNGATMTPRKWDLDTTSYGGQFLFLNPTRRGEDVVSPSVVAALHARLSHGQPALPVRPFATWKELSIRVGDVRLQSPRYVVDLGSIPNDELSEVTLQVTNETAEPRGLSIRVDDPTLEAAWEGGTWVTPVEAGTSRNLRIRIQPSTQRSTPSVRSGRITFLSGQQELVSVDVKYDLLPPRIRREVGSGTRSSGVRKAFSSPYDVCLGPAPQKYTIVADSARFWLTGDRSCGAWSTCDWMVRDDTNVCFRFTLQGHDEFFDSGVRDSEGHLSAEYKLTRQAIRLSEAPQ